MERVTGIGGLFFRSHDPDGLAAWYAEHLGITPVPLTYDEASWQQQAGPTVFAAFDAGAEHFGRPQQQWMVNFRVRDLDAMVAQLRSHGIEVEVDDEVYPNGRFARVHDPEGNPVELWQPQEVKLASPSSSASSGAGSAGAGSAGAQQSAAMPPPQPGSPTAP